MPVCPVGAIFIAEDGLSEINRETCVECHNCYRSLSYEHLPPGLTRIIRRILKSISLRFQPEPDVCPTEAIAPDELEWPRIVRRAFSDPMVTHESTGVHGRGTEEVKTNDVSNRIKQGDVGLVVEFGRPGIGVYFKEVQKITRALAGSGAEFEAGNPVTQMMTSAESGNIQADILEEKVLSCIVELTVPLKDTARLLRHVTDACKDVETVISIGLSTVCDKDGKDSIQSIIQEEGFQFGWAKVNLGLGRVSNSAAIRTEAA